MFYSKIISIIFFTFFVISNAFSAIDFNDDESSTPQASNQNERINEDRGTERAGVDNKKLSLAENNPIAALLCKAIRAFTGTIAKILAVFMVIGLGVAMLSATPQNPITPTTIVCVIIGVGILFSAETLIGIFTGEAGEGGGDSKKSCDCKYGFESACNRSL